MLSRARVTLGCGSGTIEHRVNGPAAHCTLPDTGQRKVLIIRMFQAEGQGYEAVRIRSRTFPCGAGAKDYRSDIEIVSAKRWPTVVTLSQLEQVTQLSGVPPFLSKDVGEDRTLYTYANGEIYRIKGVHAKVTTIRNFEAATGAGDTHFSVMHGSRSSLVIRQGESEGYQPVL